LTGGRSNRLQAIWPVKFLGHILSPIKRAQWRIHRIHRSHRSHQNYWWPK